MALVLASRRTGVTRYLAPWSSDFPRALPGLPGTTRDRPADSLTWRSLRPGPGGHSPGYAGAATPNSLTALASTRPTMANEMSAWVPIASLAHDFIGIVSVGLKALAVVKPTYR